MRKRNNNFTVECSDCIHDNKSPNDQPCYHCLSGYNGRTDFTPKHPDKTIFVEKENKDDE